jgi:hypothetical protein
MKRRVFPKTTPFHVKKREDRNGVVLNDTVPLSSSPGRAAGEERKMVGFSSSSVLPLSLDRMPCQKTEGAAPRQPRPLADHPPRAYPKNRERNLDSCTQMADQPPQPLLPMCNHKKPRPLAL